MRNNLRIKNRNMGVTLVELIVVTAIMATLTGLLVPQFMKYVKSRRQIACRQNRESILNIYEKCVYGTTLVAATDDSFKNLIQRSLGSEVDYNGLAIPDEYKKQIKTHWMCPSGGTLSVKVVNGVAYCMCDEDGHDTDDCVIDLTGWEGTENEGADSEFDVPTVTPTPIPTDTPTPTPTITPTPTEKIGNSYWPYADDPRWEEDATGGSYQSAKIWVIAPSGRFASRYGVGGVPKYYVVVDRNAQVYDGPEAKYKGTHGVWIFRESCEFPDKYVVGAGGSEALVECSGTEYTPSSLVEAIEKYPYLKSSGSEQYYMNFGDIYIFEDGTRYIYGSTASGYVTLPQKGMAKDGNWYIMAMHDEIE